MTERLRLQSNRDWYLARFIDDSRHSEMAVCSTSRQQAERTASSFTDGKVADVRTMTAAEVEEVRPK